MFNHALPSWLALAYLILQKHNRFILVIITLTMITGIFPFIGLFIVAISVIIRNIISDNTPKIDEGTIAGSLLNLFSVENIIGGGIIGIVSYLFLKTNISGHSVNFIASGFSRGLFFLWFLFYMVEIGVYGIAIFKYQKRNYLFYVSLVVLAIIPYIKVGSSIDFCNRASIPFILLLALMVIDSMEKAFKKLDKNFVIAILIILIIGGVTSQREIVRTSADTVERFRNKIRITQEAADLMEIPQKNDFWGYIENSVFFDVLAKSPKAKSE
jgi:hypothetical protein